MRQGAAVWRVCRPAIRALTPACAAVARMLEHYSHIRIDAKRQALDALDAARRGPRESTGGDDRGARGRAIPAIAESGDWLTSQSGLGGLPTVR